MNGPDQTAMSPTRFALKISTKLAIFSLACLAGWAVAVIVHQTIMWLRSPASHNAGALGAALQQLIDCILNALYR